MMEVIKNDDTSDKGFGLVRDKIPVRTLKFGFRVSILLGEGGRVVGTRSYMHVEVIRPVRQMSIAGVCGRSRKRRRER